jgi:hypothetical protein
VPGSTSLASAQLLRAVRQASGARQTHLTFKDSEFISLMLILQARPHATRVAVSIDSDRIALMQILQAKGVTLVNCSLFIKLQLGQR